MTVIFSDDFNRANGSLGSSWSSDGDVTVNSNALRNSATYPNVADKVTELSADNWVCDITFASALSNGVPELIFRSNAARSSYYKATWSASEILVYDESNNIIGYAGGSYGAATTGKVDINGSAIKISVGGTQVISITDTLHSGGAGNRYLTWRLANATANAHGIDSMSIDDGGAGAQTWTGSAATVSIAATSGSWSAARTWSGSAAAVTVTGTSGSFVPGARTWTGSAATVSIAGTSGTWSTSGGAQTWTGSAAAVTVTGSPGSFVAGAVTWSGSAAAVALAAAAGAFAAGAAAWAGSAGTVAVSATSSSFVAGVTVWAGSLAAVALAGVSGSWSNTGDQPGFVELTYAAAAVLLAASAATVALTGAAASVTLSPVEAP